MRLVLQRATLELGIFHSKLCAYMTVSSQCNYSPDAAWSMYHLQSLTLTAGRLNAYYIYIHQYFPILPPPVQPITPDNPIRATSLEGCFPLTLTSPLALAMSAMLALIPFADQEPLDVSSEEPLRRAVAHKLAQLALEGVESDSELLDCTPGGHPSPVPFKGQPIPRFPLHPTTPVMLEGLLALLLLSNYEHTQRGNMLKMTTRASQALIMAKNMGLHRLTDYDDEFAEAKRRAWWMSVGRIERCRSNRC